MSRFRKLSAPIWHCQYHVVWVPKYRYRILTGRVSEEVARCIRAFSEHPQAEVVELRVQIDPVHLLAMVPPKVSMSSFVGTVKGRTATRVFSKFRESVSNTRGNRYKTARAGQTRHRLRDSWTLQC